jgi:hypothetical protein
MNYDYVSSATNRPLAAKMLADPTYRAMYISCFCNLMPYFNNTNMDPVIDSLANVIRADVYADNLKSYTNQQFEDNINMQVNMTPGIKSFISARSASLTSQLSFTNCWLGTPGNNPVSQTLSIYPNPAQNSATLHIPASATTAQITVLDVNGNEVENLSMNRVSDTTFQLSTAEMANGVYFIVLNSDGNPPLTSKLVVMH